jgi:hypothetical protein
MGQITKIEFCHNTITMPYCYSNMVTIYNKHKTHKHIRYSEIATKYNYLPTMFYTYEFNGRNIRLERAKRIKKQMLNDNP